MATPPPPAFVYRISTGSEWAELQRTGCTLGGDLDRSTSCFHLSDHAQVKMTLKNYFHRQNDLYLLQIDTAKIADGLIYEAADGCNYFPDRSFAPLQLSAVIKAEKIELANNAFTCSLLDGAAI
ncbi:uncharacterized protein LOC123428258 [Hordeum vulgare subsp. vulgare]|uniref:DUF952 domain-containing protein n=1 Tax=Hordeum vulgare subsp. vulgare TaxID=112509 RepID=A0A8I6XHZ9_HORVV|nr:uncharacterized protein LOC123428258 [Hordeum vulgare subsp. vulgare]KAI5010009.1 hypothetical protein ZWY2020_012146 [Hordeum vulgare]